MDALSFLEARQRGDTLVDVVAAGADEADDKQPLPAVQGRPERPGAAAIAVVGRPSSRGGGSRAVGHPLDVEDPLLGRAQADLGLLASCARKTAVDGRPRRRPRAEGGRAERSARPAEGGRSGQQPEPKERRRRTGSHR